MRIAAGRPAGGKTKRQPETRIARHHGLQTYRRFDVGAEATDAKAERPGKDGPRELGKPLLPPGLWFVLSSALKSGTVPDACDEADDAPAAASVVDCREGVSVEEDWL